MIEPCWANQKPRSVPPILIPASIGRSRMPKPKEHTNQITREIWMVRMFAFQ